MLYCTQIHRDDVLSLYYFGTGGTSASEIQLSLLWLHQLKLFDNLLDESMGVLVKMYIVEMYIGFGRLLLHYASSIP